MAHHKRADDGTHAPEAVQPAHVSGAVVQGHVAVQRRINRTGAQAVRDSACDKHPEGIGAGKSVHRQCRQEHADRYNHARAEAAAQSIRQKAGKNRNTRDDHRDDAHRRDRDVHGLMHGRPGRSQKRIRQTEADKRKIDHRKQQRADHVSSPILIQHFIRYDYIIFTCICHGDTRTRCGLCSFPLHKDCIGRFLSHKAC